MPEMPDDDVMFDHPAAMKLYFRPVTAREALLEIRRIAETGPDSIETGMIGEVAQAGLDQTGMGNFELTDRLADYFGAAIEVLRRVDKEGFSDNADLEDRVTVAMALPPDIEEMVERRVGSNPDRPESAEQVRLQLADILVEGRSQVLRKMAVTRDLEGRKILGEMDQLIQAMFERFAPERWAEELAKAEAAESAAPSPDEDGERIEVMAKVLAGLADRGAQSWIDLPDAVRDGFRHKARAVWAADQDLIKRRIEAAE